jgi:PKD repeat protein
MPSSSLARRRHRSRGQSVVELALIAPVFLLLLLTALDLGRLMYSQITITNAAKEGALVASQGGTFQNNQACSDTNTVMCGVLSEARGGFVEVDRARVTLAPATCVKDAMYPAVGAPPNVSVTVQAPFRVITPIIGAVIGNNLLVTAEADAQCLVVPAVTYPALPRPTAAFTANPTSGTVPPNLRVNVDASGSTAVGATIASYQWSFGGSSVTGSTTYSAPGTYTISLTVTDSRGQTDSTSRTITVTGSGPGPICPTVSFTATDKANTGNPHRMDLDGTISDPPKGWVWAWTGAISESGQNPKNVNFPSSGPHSVTLTVTKGSCSVTTTQTVIAP